MSGDAPSIAIVRTTFSPRCCCQGRQLLVDCEWRITYRDFQDKSLATIFCFYSVENGRELLSWEFDCSSSQFYAGDEKYFRWKQGRPTVDNSTDDLMDLAMGRICAGKASTEGRSKVLAQRLEGTRSGRRTGEPRGPERASNAAVYTRSASPFHPLKLVDR